MRSLNLRICVFGTGAVGAYFGGRLAEAGEDVAFVARGQVLRAVREHGLRVTSTEGDFVIQRASSPTSASASWPEA
ncbi:MAG: ketopantoate reductase family protein [Gemmatimonadales bacterium]